MPEPVIPIDVKGWVAEARSDPVDHRRRQATEIVLSGIASLLPAYTLHLKGGLLMGLVYDSPRMTTDVDLSAGFPVHPGIGNEITSALVEKLKSAIADLAYVGVDVNVHSVKELPKNKFDQAQFPGLTITIVHSHQQSAMARKPLREYFTIDISFNEALREIDILEIADGKLLLAYGLVDLIAEKYRAVLQQIPRCRQRRQDIYDLHHLTIREEIDEGLKGRILDVLLEKC